MSRRAAFSRALGVPQLVPKPVAQALAAHLTQGVEQGGVGGEGVLPLPIGQGVQQGGGVEHDSGAGQLPISGYAPQGGA